MNAKDLELNAPQFEMFHSKKPINLMLCGVGTGKTFELAIMSATYATMYPIAIHIIAANTYMQLNNSTLTECFAVWGNIFGMVEGTHYVVGIIPPSNFKRNAVPKNGYKNTISFINGALMHTRSLDRHYAIDGMQATFGWLDETKDTKEDAVLETILTRLRQNVLWIDKNGDVTEEDTGGKAFNPMFCFTSPSREMWLNELFKIDERYQEIEDVIYDKNKFFNYEDKLRKVVIASTWHNEHNLPRNWINEKIEIYGNDKDRIKRLIYGSPVSRTGAEFIKNFNKLVHVKPTTINPDNSIHVSIDINSHPYITAVAMQIEFVNEKTVINIVGESALRDPRNKMASLALDIEDRFASKANGFYYYGDASGKNRNTISRTYNNEYDVLEDLIPHRLNSDSDRVLFKNPSVTKSRDLLDEALQGLRGFQINIDSSCLELIRDLNFTKEDANGNMAKTKGKDKISGVVCELRGHHLDALRYMFWYLFQKK